MVGVVSASRGAGLRLPGSAEGGAGVPRSCGGPAKGTLLRRSGRTWGEGASPGGSPGPGPRRCALCSRREGRSGSLGMAEAGARGRGAAVGLRGAAVGLRGAGEANRWVSWHNPWARGSGPARPGPGRSLWPWQTAL